MTVPDVVVRGVVLRETETKESDKILTLLTGELGKIAVVARGARRKNCKFAAAAQSLALSEWSLYHRGEWYYAREGSTLELFAGLRRDLELLALGSYFAELTESVTVEGSPAPELLRHLLNGLYALSTLHKDPELVKPAFELKLLSLAGYEPLADGCAVCGRKDPGSPRLDVVRGVVCCGGCTVQGNTFTVPLCRGSLAALRHILYGDEKRLYSFTLGPEPLERLSRAGESFLNAQLERRFRTLDYYKGLRGPERRGNMDTARTIVTKKYGSEGNSADPAGEPAGQEERP